MCVCVCVCSKSIFFQNVGISTFPQSKHMPGPSQYRIFTAGAVGGGTTRWFPSRLMSSLHDVSTFLAFSLQCLRLPISILSSYTDVCLYANTSQRSWMLMQGECLAALTLITNYLVITCRLTVCLPWHTGGRRAVAATSLTLLLCV